MLALVTLAFVFPWTVADSPLALRFPTLLSTSHFLFTTSGLMTDYVELVSTVKVCSLPFMYSHAGRLLLFCRINDIESRFSLMRVLVKIVSSLPVYYS